MNKYELKYMLENFGGTPSTEEALVLLVDSYNDLGIYDLAYDSSRVLIKNYPNYKIVQSDIKEPIKIKKDIPVPETKIQTTDESDGSWYDFIPFLD